MRKRRNNQAGFSGFELVVVLVVVIIVASVGFVVYRNQNKTTASSTTPKNTASDPYSGWKTHTLRSSKITFRYPAGWSVDDSSVTKGQSQGAQSDPADHTVDSVNVYSSAATADGTYPSGAVEVSMTTDGDATPVTSTQNCQAGPGNCRQYAADQVTISAKKLYLVTYGSTSTDGAGKKYETLLMGPTQSSSCVDLCIDGLGHSPLQGNVETSVGYVSKYNETHQQFIADTNIQTGKKILESIVIPR